MIQAWHVLAWEPVAVKAAKFDRALHTMQDICVSFHVKPIEECTGIGQALWGKTVADGRRIGIAWDFAILNGNIPVLADPCSISTNIVLTDEGGCPIDPEQRFLRLSEAVLRKIHWHEAAIRHALTPNEDVYRTSSAAG